MIHRMLPWCYCFVVIGWLSDDVIGNSHRVKRQFIIGGGNPGFQSNIGFGGFNNRPQSIPQSGAQPNPFLTGGGINFPQSHSGQAHFIPSFPQPAPQLPHSSGFFTVPPLQAAHTPVPPTVHLPQGNGKPNRRPNRRRKKCKKKKNRNKPECLEFQAQENLNQLPWLKSLTQADNKSVSLPGLPKPQQHSQQTRFFQLGQGFADEPHQQCTTPRFEPGHCRHLQHCILQEFIYSFDFFIRYVCIINGFYIGVCCPDHRYATPPPIATPPPTPPPPTQPPTQPPSQRGCGLNNYHQTKIVGGQISSPKKYPWSVALLRRFTQQFCGGALIDNRHVVTAAHCVVSFTPSTITVRLGEYTFTDQSETPHRDFGVANIKVHELYDTTTQVNDIAILTLTSTTAFNDHIWPICLPQKGRNIVGETATVVGWGTIEFTGPVSNVLREVNIPVWRNEECDAAYPDQNIVTLFLCAGDKLGGRDACQGDSGGPLMLQDPVSRRYELIGIVSWGIGCALPNRPGVYTRVTEFIDWIQTNSV